MRSTRVSEWISSVSLGEEASRNLSSTSSLFHLKWLSRGWQEAGGRPMIADTSDITR
jgi:hypothetical protein